MERPLVAGVSPIDVVDLGIGAAKSVPSAVLGLGKNVRTLGGLGELAPDEQQAFEPKTWGIEPTNIAQERGKVLGDIGQFVLAGEAQAPAFLARLMASSRFARGTGEGLKVSGVTAAQEGEADPATMLWTFLTGAALGQGAKKPKVMQGPFAGSVDAKVTEAANRLRIEMPASARSTAPMVPLLESLAAKGPLGGQAATRARTAALSLEEAAARTVEASKISDPVAAGSLIVKRVGEFKDAWLKEKQVLYDAVDIPAWEYVIPKKTLAILDDVISERRVGMSPDLKLFEKLRLSLQGGKESSPVSGHLVQTELRDLRTIVKEWNRRFHPNSTDPIAKGDEALAMKLNATLTEEFEAFLGARDPKVLEVLKRANARYVENDTLVSTALGATFSRMKNTPDSLLRALIRPNMSATNIPRVREIVGQETAEAIQGTIIADIIQKAHSRTTKMLTPGGLTNEMGKWGDKLQMWLTPEQYAKLDDLATLTAAMQRSQKVMEGSQTEFLQRISATIAAASAGTMASVASGNPIPAAVAFSLIAGGAAANRLIASKAGQKWLTEGFGPEGVKAMKRSIAEGTLAQMLKSKE